MPVIRLSDAIFKDLKSVSTWLDTETPSQTIGLLVAEKLEQIGLEPEDRPKNSNTRDTSVVEKIYRVAPRLAFTRVLDATVNGEPIGKLRWSNLLLDVIGAVKAKGLDAIALSKEVQVPTKAFEFEKDGYRYEQNLGISVQGQSAQDAWKEISRLARKHRIDVFVRFKWRDVSKAQKPGMIGILRAS